MEGLENKLDGVYMGDLIILDSPNLNVVGYVVDFNSINVTLSHENPVGLSSGNRFYDLRKFESYMVLKHPEEKSE